MERGERVFKAKGTCAEVERCEKNTTFGSCPSSAIFDLDLFC